MTVKELIEKLDLYNPEAKVVIECEHDSYTGHEVVETRVSSALHVTIVGSLGYIENHIDPEWPD